MNRKVSLVVIHVLGCLIFLALPYLLAEDGFQKLAELPQNSHEQRNLLSYVLAIAFFYVNYYVLTPKLFFVKKYVLYALCVVGCFLLIEGVLTTINRQGFRPAISQPPAPDPAGHRPPPPVAGDWHRPPPPGPFARPERRQPAGLPSEISQTLFLFLIGLLLSLAIRINNRWRETERNRLNTELSYLKAQINPHFLFNTLNSIYSLAIEQSDRTAEAITRLSSLMRYVIQDATTSQVQLTKELEYISHYVALQQLRLDGTIPINFSMTGRAQGLSISPLILISFIENAFKYGVNPNEDSAIDIHLSIRENELHCHVSNKKVPISQTTAHAGGVGLANTKARLALIYPNRHRLLISDQATDFTVDLYLTLS